MARREWAGKIVKQEMTGYHWNARIRKSTVLLPDIAAKLLVKEHARAVRIIKKRKKAAYFEKDGMSADQFDAYIAALDDVYSDVMKGRL